MLSERESKENFSTVDPLRILDALSKIPIWSWNYRAQDPTVRHVGPVAEDFHTAFGLGENNTHISNVDVNGVALTAIQGLHSLVMEKTKRIEQLELKNQSLSDRLTDLESHLRQLQIGSAVDPISLP